MLRGPPAAAPARRRVGVEDLPGGIQGHAHCHQPGLRAVVQVPLDPAHLRRPGVDRLGPGLGQMTDPQRELRLPGRRQHRVGEPAVDPQQPRGRVQPERDERDAQQDQHQAAIPREGGGRDRYRGPRGRADEADQAHQHQQQPRPRHHQPGEHQPASAGDQVRAYPGPAGAPRHRGGRGHCSALITVSFAAVRSCQSAGPTAGPAVTLSPEPRVCLGLPLRRRSAICRVQAARLLASWHEHHRERRPRQALPPDLGAARLHPGHSGRARGRPGRPERRWDQQRAARGMIQAGRGFRDGAPGWRISVQ
jgi:hypothetical protein